MPIDNNFSSIAVLMLYPDPTYLHKSSQDSLSVQKAYLGTKGEKLRAKNLLYRGFFLSLVY